MKIVDINLTKDEVLEKIKEYLTTFELFKKCVSVNSKLMQIGSILVVLGFLPLFYNLVDTCIAILSNPMGRTYFFYYFPRVFFDMEGQNMIYAVSSAIGFILLLIGGGMLAIFYFQKSRIVEDLYQSYQRGEKAISYIHWIRANKHVLFRFESEEKLEEFERVTSTITDEKIEKRFHKLIKRVTEQNKASQLKSFMKKKMGFEMGKITTLLPSKGNGVVSCADGYYTFLIADDKKIEHRILTEKIFQSSEK